MSPADLHQHLAAYADEQLDPNLRGQIETHLADHPADRSEVDRLRALRRSVHRTLNADPVSDTLADRIRAGLHARPRAKMVRLYRIGLPGLAVAAAAVLAFSLWPRGAVATPVEAAGFVNIYRLCAVSHRHDEYGVRGAKFPGCLTRLQERSGFNCCMPDLSTFGPYEIDGACHCAPVDDIRVVHAFFRRADAPNAVVSIFAVDRRIELMNHGTACAALRSAKRSFRTATDGDVTLIGWSDGNRSFVLVGQQKQSELERLAEDAAVAQTRHDLSVKPVEVVSVVYVNVPIR